MKFVVRLSPVMGCNVVFVEHRNRSLEWPIGKLYTKLKEKELELSIMFDELNGFINQLPHPTQEGLFNLYSQIHQTLENSYTIDAMIPPLMGQVEELYKIINVADLGHWIKFHAGVYIPPSIPDVYIDDEEKTYTPERTYLKSDYLDLLIFTVAVRAMVPVWGLFFEKVKDEVRVYMEDTAYKLLSRSSLWTCDALNKLLVYIDKTIQDEPTEEMILRGIPSDEFNAWVASLVIIRRLTISKIKNIPGTADTTEIVSYLHAYIRNKTKNQDNSYTNRVKHKNYEAEGPKGESSNLSRLENNRTRRKINPGDIVAIQNRGDDYMTIYNKLSRVHDHQMLGTFLACSQGLEQIILNPSVHIVLVQWMIAREFPARGVPHLKKKTVLNLIAVAQALLWERGHIELAAIAGSRPVENSTNVLQPGKKPKELEKQIRDLYPYKRIKGKRKTDTNILETGLDAITIVNNEIGNRQWELLLPEDLGVQVCHGEYRRIYTPPDNLYELLCKLMVDINQQ